MKSSVNLNTTTIQTLVCPQPEEDRLVQALYTNQYRMLLMSLYQLYERLSTEAPPLVESTDFAHAIQHLRSFSLSAQKRVLEYPTMSFWIDVAWDLVNHNSHLLFPTMHIQEHIQDFWRFVLAAALQDGQHELTCVIRSNSKGVIVLPSASTFLQMQQQEPYTRFKVLLTGKHLQLFSYEGSIATTFSSQPIPMCQVGIEINAVDDDVRLPGRTSGQYEELTLDTTLRWQQSLDLAWDQIMRTTPLLAQEIQLGVRVISPVCSSPDVHLSGSYHEAPGLVTLSWTPDQNVLAEALVHEYHHQKLHALMSIDPLIIGPTHDPIYYSPWRKDPRPLRGILHAAFTFQAILEFYNRLIASQVIEYTESISQRVYKCYKQVTIAFEILKEHAYFSVLGMALLESIKQNLVQQQTLMPALDIAGKLSVDETLMEHRREWERAYPDLVNDASSSLPKDIPPLPENPLLSSPPPHIDEKAKKLEQHLLTELQIASSTEIFAFLKMEEINDPVLESLQIAKLEQRLSTIASLVKDVEPGKSLLLDLIAAHMAYISDEYERARLLYKLCLQHYLTNIHLWQYYAFTLRQLREWEDSTLILSNLQRLVDPRLYIEEDNNSLVEARLEHIRQNEVPMDQGAIAHSNTFQKSVSILDEDHSLARLFGNSIFQRVFEFAPTGNQLPSFIAVAHELKPSMDLWISPDGWAGFQSLVADLGLVYFVDTFFDPFSQQLERIPLDSFTTTRAALSKKFGAHTQAHIFLARNLEHLYTSVSSGWYPLVIDGYLVHKHMPDHDKFGDALGYPLCCQQFFRERNDWRYDNTFFAAYHNTSTTPHPLSNGFLRHTLFSLAPYIPCSMACQATIEYATRLQMIIASEVPEYALEIKRHLSSPILCLSELRVYRFSGEMTSNSSVIYNEVERIYESSNKDELYERLLQGNHCTIDGNIVRIYNDHNLVATHLARADRHGPEMPFLVNWS